MILRYRPLWLLLAALGGLAPLGVVRGQRPPPDYELALELLERVEQLEAEIRQVRGELEMQRHRLELLQQERATALPAETVSPSGAVPAIPERPARTEDRPEPVRPPAASAPPPASADRDATAPPPTSARTEQSDFDAALGELREGRYAEAVAGFQRFMSAHPASDLAGDAQYWLGESHYVSRNYEAAKDAFINMGLHYPQSGRLPDALLKLGYIYGEQGETERAREVLQKLMQVYPNTQAASLAGRRLQSLQ